MFMNSILPAFPLVFDLRRIGLRNVYELIFFTGPIRFQFDKNWFLKRLWTHFFHWSHYVSIWEELVCETFMNSFLSLVLSGFMHSLFYLFKDKRGDFLQTSTESMKPNGNTEQELIENCHVYQLDLKLNLWWHYTAKVTDAFFRVLEILKFYH